MIASPIPAGHPLQPAIADGQNVKIIGLGGVGSIVARYSAVFLASLGKAARLFLIDGDSFEPSNASRMFFGAFGPKAQVLRDELVPRFLQTNLAILAVPQFLTRANVTDLVHERDIILVLVDNFATRKLVQDRCGALRDVCCISAGNDGVGADASGIWRRGTYANAQIYIRSDGHDATPPFAYLHPEIADPVDHVPTEQDCIEAAASAPQRINANFAAAGLALDALWLLLAGALHYSEIATDVAEGRSLPQILTDRLHGPAERSSPAIPVAQPDFARHLEKAVQD